MFRLMFWTILAASALAACSRGLLDPWPELEAPRVRRDFRVIGWSVEARPIYAHVYGGGAETVLLLSGLHGNAPAGKHLLRQFMTHLEANPDRVADRRVVVIPSLNPDGFERRSRQNAHGVDLDRNLPSANWLHLTHCGRRPASEPETAALLLALEKYDPARVLVVAGPLNRVTYLGGAGPLAARMAETSGYLLDPVPFRPPSGSLAAYAGKDHRIPTVVFDLKSRERYEGMWGEMHEALEIFVLGEEGMRDEG
jgi:hypothetical protein